jgi:hypothetical protein
MQNFFILNRTCENEGGNALHIQVMVFISYKFVLDKSKNYFVQ